VPIPERLLLAHGRGEVLLVAGAGISMFAGLPDFRGLVMEVYETLDPEVHAVISAKLSVLARNGHGARRPNLTPGQKAEIKRFQQGEYDVALGMLERRLEQGVGGNTGRESLVREKIGAILRVGSNPAPIHRALIRLADRGDAAAIITTNFDLLLEGAARAIKQPMQTYTLGGAPRPTRRREFSGILHIHGALDRKPQRTSNVIISDQDFGEYYFRRRVVPDLVYDAARLYHLVLVGYSANDALMRYLLSAIAADVTHFPDIKERFIFVGMPKDDPVAKEDWRARGLTPITYETLNGCHAQLQRTMARWAELSAINGRRSRIDQVMKRIVKTRRSEATDEQCDFFDHLIRRSVPTERDRLSTLISGNKADLGWLDSIVRVSSQEDREDRQ